MNIPPQGKTAQEVLDTLAAYKENDLDWRSGRATSYVYHPGDEAMDVVSRAYTMYLTESMLDPTTCPSVLRMENEVVGMMADLLRGGPDMAGSFTSGGTESVLMAVLAARNYARENRPEIQTPEVVVPFTAHACFYKAGHYLGVKMVTTPVHDGTFKADVDAMREAITDNTVMLVGSAPGWAHGVVDPIEDIAALAQEKNLLCHTDACVGGLHLSMMRRMGMDVPAFDFSVPGVTSISTDLHKYGYAAKNASLIMYRDKSLRRHQFFACSSWPGYTIVNPTAGSSRTGGSLAGAWAILNFMGEDGYRKVVKEVNDAARVLIDGINAMDELEVNGEPDMCIFSFSSTTDRLNVYKLADELKLRGGWHVQPQFARANSRSNLHIGATCQTVPHAETLLKDIKDTVADLMQQPAPSGPSLADALKGATFELNEDTVNNLLAMAGIESDDAPERMEEINTVLEALPVDLVEFILTVYLNNLFKAE